MPKKHDTAAGHPYVFRLAFAGAVLTAIPVVFMLAFAIAGSLACGELRVDFLLPAEMFFLTIPGMLLVAFAAIKRRMHRRFAIVLLVTAVLALVLCQGLAVISGIASGNRPAQGPVWCLVLALLVIYDLAALIAPVIGFRIAGSNHGG